MMAHDDMHAHSLADLWFFPTAFPLLICVVTSLVKAAGMNCLAEVHGLEKFGLQRLCGGIAPGRTVRHMISSMEGMFLLV